MMTALAAIAGTLSLGAAAASFWLLLPIDGVPHALATKPYLGPGIPLGIMIAAVFGVFALAVAVF
jgi:hypothetical protein